MHTAAQQLGTKCVCDVPTLSLSSRTSPKTTIGAANTPQMMAAQGSTTAQPAVIATRPMKSVQIEQIINHDG